MTREINWFATPAGQSLLADAMRQTQPLIWPLCGHNALLLLPAAVEQPPPPMQCEPVTRLWRSGRRFCGDVLADGQDLPIANDCMALVYAAFVLESAESPMGLLHEMERLLVSEGHLALLTLNPYSLNRLSGSWRYMALKTRVQWSRCLQDAGLEVIRHEMLGPLWARTGNAPNGSGSSRPSGLRSVNFLLARKRKAALTPIRKNSKAVALARETTQA